MGSMFNFLTAAALTTVLQVAVLQVPAHAQESRGHETGAPPPGPPPAQRSPGAPPAAEPPREAQDSENHRFVFHRVDGNLLRLDMRTGAVDTCGPTGADWTCAPGRDDRAALDREIARLQRDNATLKNALLEHGVSLPDGMAPPPPGTGNWWSGEETIPRPPQTVPPAAASASPAPGNPVEGAQPARSQFDQIVDAVEKGWRRLVEIMTDLKHDLEK